MIVIKTIKGREIECDLVIRSVQYNALSIYTHAITPVEAFQIFEDPSESAVLEVREDGKDDRIYHNFTDVYSVSRDGLITGPDEIMIVLKRPLPDDEEVISDGA